ncbi:MAG: hypothetical protein QOH63_3469 [Acidobacteriota bacterium]|nr:hypothetical protein [Acidobacteriota bacterium]
MRVGFRAGDWKEFEALVSEKIGAIIERAKMCVV